MIVATQRKPGPQAARRRGLWFWHRWAGLVAAIVLVLAATSGALLVYKKPLVHWLVTPGASLSASYGPRQMVPELDRIVRTHPPGLRERIKAPNDEEPYWTLTANDGNIQLLSVGDLAPFDDALGVLDVFAFVRHLHTELLAGVTGEAVYLVAGLLGLVLVGSGLVLWWPTRRLLRWRWVWPRPCRLALFLQYHRHGGALASPLLLVVVLTGSLMLWQKLVMPLLPAVATTAAAVEIRAEPTAGGLLTLALAQVPDGWPTYIRLPDPERGQADIRFRLPGEWHPNGRTSVTLDARSGELVVSRRSDRVSTVRWWVNQLYPLHSGYGVLGWLSLTGVVSYLRRR